MGEAASWCLVPVMVERLSCSNSHLSENQKEMLSTMLKQACRAWSEGKSLRPILRPIVALVIEDGAEAFDAIEALIAATERKSGCKIQKEEGYVLSTEEAKLAAATEKQMAKQADEILHLVYGIPTKTVSKLSHDIQAALMKTLQTHPECGITLESLLSETAGLVQNVAMIVQRTGGKVHVYLYKRDALEEWFATKLTNPLTQQSVDREREYFVLS